MNTFPIVKLRDLTLDDVEDRYHWSLDKDVINRFTYEVQNNKTHCKSQLISQILNKGNHFINSHEKKGIGLIRCLLDKYMFYERLIFFNFCYLYIHLVQFRIKVEFNIIEISIFG